MVFAVVWTRTDHSPSDSQALNFPATAATYKIWFYKYFASSSISSHLQIAFQFFLISFLAFCHHYATKNVCHLAVYCKLVWLLP